MFSTLSPSPFKHLQPGRQYQVVAPFVDYDGWLHPSGESWTFVTHSFLPYEDGLSLFVATDGTERQIRLQWTAEAQGSVIEQLEDHVHLVER